MEVHRAKGKYASQYSRESHALTNARKNNEIVENAIIRTRLPSIYLKNLCMICLAAKSKRHCLFSMLPGNLEIEVKYFPIRKIRQHYVSVRG